MNAPTSFEAIVFYVFSRCDGPFCQAWEMQNCTGVEYRNWNLPFRSTGVQDSAAAFLRAWLHCPSNAIGPYMWHNEPQADFLVRSKRSVGSYYFKQNTSVPDVGSQSILPKGVVTETFKHPDMNKNALHYITCIVVDRNHFHFLDYYLFPKGAEWTNLHTNPAQWRASAYLFFSTRVCCDSVRTRSFKACTSTGREV